jgi:hypothetical protein
MGHSKFDSKEPTSLFIGWKMSSRTRSMEKETGRLWWSIKVMGSDFRLIKFT